MVFKLVAILDVGTETTPDEDEEKRPVNQKVAPPPTTYPALTYHLLNEHRVVEKKT